MIKKLNEMKIDEYAVVNNIEMNNDVVRRRLLDMGITPGAKVKMKRIAPLGDPIEINVRGYELSIRRDEAKQVFVETE